MQHYEALKYIRWLPAVRSVKLTNQSVDQSADGISRWISGVKAQKWRNVLASETLWVSTPHLGLPPPISLSEGTRGSEDAMDGLSRCQSCFLPQTRHFLHSKPPSRVRPVVGRRKGRTCVTIDRWVEDTDTSGDPGQPDLRGKSKLRPFLQVH